MAVLVCYLGKLDQRVQTAETMSIYCLCHEASTGVLRSGQSSGTNAQFYCCCHGPRDFNGYGFFIGFDFWANIVEKYVLFSYPTLGKPAKHGSNAV